VISARKSGQPGSPLRAVVPALIALALAVAPRAARADDAPKSEPPRSDGRPPAKLKVLKLDEFTVEGRIQKPQAFFILQRSTLSFEDPDKKESFLPKIVKTCDKDPF
jgi:hypothetical protein